MLKPLVAFICERLSLAVVAVGTVFMVLIFVVVEVGATHLGSYQVILENNSNRVESALGASAAPPLQPNDRVDLGLLTRQERFALFRWARAGAQMTIEVTRNHREFPVQLTATSPDLSRRAKITRDVGAPLIFFLALALGSALFLMRPRPITLAFYIYTLLMLIKVNQTALDIAAWPVSVVSDLAIQIVYPLTQLMILIFAQRLYGRPSRVWKWLFGAAIALSAIDFIVWVDPIVWVVFQRYGLPGPTQFFMAVTDALLLVTVLTALAYIASGATGIDRSRVTWVVAGIALSPILDLTWSVTNIVNTLLNNTSPALIELQDWTDVLGPWFGLIGSIFVVYGFLSQRVVDFRFVIGRAAIYGSLTVILLVLFGTIEWAAEQIFESTRPALYVSLAAALAIGFSLSAIHGHIEGFLGRFFFRDQRRAEELLDRAARALANTSSEKTLLEFLIDEPVRVLGLSSAALFLARGPHGLFERAAACGWDSHETQSIDPEDPLIVELRAELGPIELDARSRPQTILPTGAKAPALVVPLLMRGSVYGFVFYGERHDGLPLVPSERVLLESIARNAASAYDHIDADSARARIGRLEAYLREHGDPIPE